MRSYRLFVGTTLALGVVYSSLGAGPSFADHGYGPEHKGEQKRGFLFGESADDDRAAARLAADFAAGFVEGSAPPSGLVVTRLLTITSDRDSNVDDLDIALDSSGAPQGMEVILETASGSLEGRGTADGSTPPATAPLFFSLSDITSSAGAVLNQTDGYNTLILKGTLDPNAPSSTLVLSYLSNGLTGQYDDCNVILNAPNASSPDWTVENAYTNTPVTSLKITTWSFGVSTIEGICPQSS